MGIVVWFADNMNRAVGAYLSEILPICVCSSISCCMSSYTTWVSANIFSGEYMIFCRRGCKELEAIFIVHLTHRFVFEFVIRMLLH